MNWEWRGRNRLCPNLRYPNICVKDLRKTRKDFNGDNRRSAEISTGYFPSAERALPHIQLSSEAGTVSPFENILLRNCLISLLQQPQLLNQSISLLVLNSSFYACCIVCRVCCKKERCCINQMSWRIFPSFGQWETILSLPDRSLGSSVGMATGWTAGFPFPAGAWHFSLLHSGQTGLLYIGHRGLFPRGVMRQGPWSWPLTSIYCRRREWWSYTSTPLNVFMTWFVIKHRDITFYLYLIGICLRSMESWSKCKRFLQM
jgi:hypothetical protein